jgi:hypothetical protein
MLFTKIGYQLDDEEHVLVDMLSMVEDALAERGVVMKIASGYVVLSRAEPDLVERIVAYMTDMVAVSAVPERLLTLMRADEAAAIARFQEIEDALFGRGIAIRLEHGHVVLEHAWKGCPAPPNIR